MTIKPLSLPKHAISPAPQLQPKVGSYIYPKRLQHLAYCCFFSLLASSCSEPIKPATWIEGRWEINTELSIRANGRALEQSSEELKEIFRRLASNTFWEITSNFLRVSQTISELITQQAYNVPIQMSYDILGPIIIDIESNPKAEMRILKLDDNNFCTTLWMEPKSEYAGKEPSMRFCYTRVDA